MKTRSLKIEMAGDFFRGNTHPVIRLKGRWLAAVGFKPNDRVAVIPIAAGEIPLKVERGAR